MLHMTKQCQSTESIGQHNTTQKGCQLNMAAHWQTCKPLLLPLHCRSVHLSSTQKPKLEGLNCLIQASSTTQQATCQVGPVSTAPAVNGSLLVASPPHCQPPSGL